MEVWIDGKPVKSLTVNGTVPAGSHRVAIVFTNDYYKNGQDRNLYVDKVTVQPLP